MFLPGIAFSALERATRLAVRFLDNVLTWNRGRHPLPQQLILSHKKPSL